MKDRNSLELNSIIVFILTMMASVLGVLFQSLAGHFLEDTDLYADLNAVMALFNILVLPTTASSCLISKYTAEFSKRQDMAKVRGFWYSAVRVLGCMACFFALFMLATGKWIGEWIHIEEPSIIALAAILAAVTLLSAVFTGGLQGTKAFVLYGIFGLIGPFFKIAAVLLSSFSEKKVTTILTV